MTMECERIDGQQFNSNARGQWGRLSNDQLDLIAGRSDGLITKLQELYDIGRSEAEMQVANWHKRMQKTAALLGSR